MDICSLVNPVFFTEESFLRSVGDRQAYVLSCTGLQQCAKEALVSISLSLFFVENLWPSLRRLYPSAMMEIYPSSMAMDWRLVPIHFSSHLTLITVPIPDHFNNRVVLTLHSVYSWFTYRCLEGPCMTWCILQSVQCILLSGWELGCPFRALLTQPFMSHSDGQTTAMTLPSSSSSPSSHCTHIAPSLPFPSRAKLRFEHCFLFFLKLELLPLIYIQPC